MHKTVNINPQSNPNPIIQFSYLITQEMYLFPSNRKYLFFIVFETWDEILSYKSIVIVQDVPPQ